MVPSGLWWFASLALGGLAVAGYAVGRLVEERTRKAEIHAARSELAALRATVSDTLWRTDALHGLRTDPAVAERAVAGGGSSRPWFEHPLLKQTLAEQRAFTDLRLPAVSPTVRAPTEAPVVATVAATVAAASAADRTDAMEWLLQGQPLLDPLGRFAGFVGTARALPVVAGKNRSTDSPSAASADTGLPAPEATAAERAHAAGAAQAAEAALAAARAESVEADNFSFTVSHDLRAPIRVVDGFTRIVKEDYGHLLDRVGNDHLDRVLNAAARMNQMIDALLTLARLSNQPLTRQPVNLSQIAHYVVDELQRGHPGRDVNVSIEDGMEVMGDPTLLRLVLENLLGNAWKYSARNPKAQISLATVRHGNGRAFVVRDNGAGFDMRAAERLFGVFQRLHSASEFAGHGVGLASARRIVRRHGGDIWAEAEPARGAAFSFTLSEN